jgi:NTP pyrophosphatase (non-canonical NTP hydrolase)
MTEEEYVKNALRTESPVTDELKARVTQDKNIRLMHAAMGMVTESAEFIDALKKNFYYNKTLDTVNLKEEIGDVLWYVAIACDALGVSLNQVMERNIEKLAARYPEKYSDECALHRDLKKEHEILEK